jgi:hypothetical protein
MICYKKSKLINKKSINTALFRINKELFLNCKKLILVALCIFGPTYSMQTNLLQAWNKVPKIPEKVKTVATVGIALIAAGTLFWLHYKDVTNHYEKLNAQDNQRHEAFLNEIDRQVRAQQDYSDRRHRQLEAERRRSEILHQKIMRQQEVEHETKMQNIKVRAASLSTDP